jgi:hypothetical protein
MAFKKGQSGNPGGKWSEKAFAEALRVAVNVEQEPGKPKLRAIADKLVEEALAGQGWAIQQVADRLDGKPVQGVDMEHSGSIEASSKEQRDAAVSAATRANA